MTPWTIIIIIITCWIAFLAGFLLAAIIGGRRRGFSEEDIRTMQHRWFQAGRLEERRAMRDARKAKKGTP